MTFGDGKRCVNCGRFLNISQRCKVCNTDLSQPTAREIELAKEFSEILRDGFTVEQMSEINRLNAEYAAQGDLSVCASGDVCDSNMCMAAAFEVIVGRPVKVSNDNDVDLWNAAWDIAKKNKFYVDVIK